MKTKRSNQRTRRSGVTLIELTVVIFVLISIMGASMYFAGNIGEWRKGKLASEALTEVYAAQRSFLADHPRRTVVSLTTDELVSYLPINTGKLPTVESLDGTSLEFDVTVSPPVLTLGGSPYDPSDSNKDALWDVGK